MVKRPDWEASPPTSSWSFTLRSLSVVGFAASRRRPGALIVALPTLLIYIILGRYFMRGLLAGALKG